MTDPSLPLVAVVTPVYNGARFLSEAMASVQAQTYPNLVHVVLDNASADATSRVIEAFKHGRVPIITQRNPATLPIQRNWSAAAKLVPQPAKYFQMLCADDVLTQPEAIAKMVAVAERDPDVRLIGSVRRKNDHVLPGYLPKTKTIFDGAPIIRAYLNGETNELPGPFAMFRRLDEDFAAEFFRSDILCTDDDACIRALARGKFAFVHEPLVKLRIHEDQHSNKGGLIHYAAEMLSLIERWGPLVMTPAEFRACFMRQRRKVYRLAVLRRIAGRTDLYRECVESGRADSKVPFPLGLASSLLDWPLYRLDMLLRKHWLQRSWSRPAAS